MEPIASSFRDPSGFLFKRDNLVYRMVNHSYAEDYECLMNSGLYGKLTERGLMLPHVEQGLDDGKACYKVIKPEQLEYVSYPYEWSFSQLKDSAALTLKIQLLAMEHGMTLKDASAYNVQLHQGKPVFIDTLSFEKYVEGSPWVAYRQFCQHFLAPLALISHCDFRLVHLLRAYIDGLPLDLTSSMLPKLTWLNYGLLAHVHLHSMSQRRYADEGRDSGGARKTEIGSRQLQGLIESLLSTVSKLGWQPPSTEWGDYYNDTNYVDESMKNKETLVEQFLNQSVSDTGMAADFGANTGKFSRLAAKAGFKVLSHDIDEVAVEKNYRQMVATDEKNIYPLLLDLTNPSPGLGWANEERESLVNRANLDVGLALALIHHIAISNNVPLPRAAKFFSTVCQQLIIEFVPKSDSQVKRLLATREDVFPDYNNDGFESAFSKYFEIRESVEIPGTDRRLYLMDRLTD
jgi:hypothetical protein